MRKERRIIHLSVCLALTAILVLGSSFFSSACAENMDNDGSLMHVLRVTLANHPDIKLGELEVERARGDVQSVGGDFDSKVFGNIYYDKNDNALTDYEKSLLGYDADKSESTGVEMGVRKTFRSGFEGKASVRSVRVDDQSGLEGYPDITRNAVEFSLTIPLLRRGRVTFTADERKNQLEKKAAEKRFQRILSDAAEKSVAAYWDYLEKFKSLAIKEAIEKRTSDFLSNTRRLIELGERPPSDLIQIRAQLASKRSEKIEAERILYEAKQNLGMAMGLEISKFDSLADPTESFPVINDEGACLQLPDVQKLFNRALETRGDYQASLIDAEAVGVELESEMEQIKPKIDLELSANYSGAAENHDVYDFSSEEGAGPGGTILLNGEWDIFNNTAKGTVLSIQARQRQARVRIKELERSIHSSIAVAARDVCRIATATISLNEAVELYNDAVENEGSRLRRGLTTLINLITVEDKRNTAQVALIAQQSALAKAVVRLRNETGSLVEITGDKGSFNLESLTTLPSLE